ncbi:alpha/beta hydrolase [Amylibacter sp. SFDW26]|uniref:alpha/beta fold hydrolase n=1 Tax=Amylibacter sp. SFDW26 TaxID=2652722 RepID=UPI0012627F40|nr:alpha/beta hydrolase [Amylibacter sp. SFDW26]KAB7610039.1 alpha/beta hydrolase [Amylibacter sp. SFDW26]
MKVTIRSQEVFVSTGGREFDPKQNVLMFIHGSGQSHLSFMLQGRFFANRGWAVVVADMPAHGLSKGAALTTIEDMADWHAELMDELGVISANIIGHSQGGLIALELARRHADKVKGLSQVATALAIPVNDMLLSMAENKEAAAIAAMTDWGHGVDGHMHEHTMPGQNHMNYGKQLMAANESGALFADLSACANYTDGPKAAAAVTCACQCILGQKDKMTPMKAGLQMAQALNVDDPTIVVGAGHMMPSERPFEVNKALRAFFEV